METFEVIAKTREAQSKGASRRLRRAGQVPGILYGTEKTPTPISVDVAELRKHLENEAFYSHVLTIKVDDAEAEKIVLKDVQRHPYKPEVLHVDFQRIDETHKLHMLIPLHFINEEACVGVKLGGGAISHIMSEVEVHCLAKDLPEFIEVDLAEVNTGESVHLSDLKLPEGVEIPALAHGSDHNLPVVSVQKGRGGDDDDADAEGEAVEATEE